MPTASQNRARHRSSRARGALRALLATLAATTPRPAFCVWLGPCGPWLSVMAGRRR